MAATVTSNLTTIDACDATTGWSASGGPTLILETDDHLQGTGCLSADVDVETGVFTFGLPGGSTGDWTNRYIWIWMMSLTAPYLDIQDNGGLRIRVVDSAGGYADWYVGGSDTYSGGWRCFTTSTAYTIDNNVGPVNLTAITRVGCVFKATVKSKLPANAFWDYLRYGAGITITGGTSGDPGTFANVLSGDQSADIGAIRREGGVYFVQGSFTFGDTGSSDSYFSDSGKTIIWEGTRTGDSFHQFNIVGGTGTNLFQLGTITGSGTNAVGSQGVYVNTAQHLWSFTAANTSVDTFNLGGNVFANAGTISLGSTSTKLGSTSSSISLVDNTDSSPTQVVRNLETGASTLNQLRNKVTFATDSVASLNLYDAYTTDSGQWQIVGSTSSGNGPGFRATSSGTQTLNVSSHNFNQMDKPFITIDSNETWNSINPSWTINTAGQTELDFLNATSNEVNEKYNINITVATPSGTKLQNAYTWVGETSPSIALPSDNRQATDSNGYASSDYLQSKYVDSGGTALTQTLHSDTFLKVYYYGRSPFATSLGTVSSAQNLSVTLVTDTNISETTQATAETNGSGITVDRDNTTPASIIAYTGGSGSIVAGDTVRGQTSLVTGIYRETVSGDFASGKILLQDVSGNFTNGETLEISSGTGDWSGADYTASSQQKFTWLINGNAKSLQVIYDYLCAKTAKSDGSIDSIFRDAILWGEDENAYLVQAVGGNTFKTERTTRTGMLQGVVIYNYSVGAVSYFTADDGTTFTPPSSITLTLTGVTLNTRCYIDVLGQEDQNYIMNELATTADGSYYKASVSYVWTTSVTLTFRARKAGYLPFDTSINLPSAENQTVTAVWQADPNYTP